MKRLFTFASLTLLALSSSALAGKSNPHKPENQSNQPKPIIRDHRTPNLAPVVRDHRTSSGQAKQQPKIVNSGFGKLSGGGYVNVNGVVQRAPAVNKPQVPLTHPMSPQTPPRDPRKTLTSQDLVNPGAKDQRFTPVTSGSPVVRDHRDQSGYGRYPYYGNPNVSNMSGGVMVTESNGRGRNPKIVDSRVAVAPQLSPRGTPPVVRDHRVSANTANYNWPSINQTTGPVVRDHRGTNGNGQGGVTVTSTPGSRDNTIYGTGPGLHTVVDAASSGLTSVGNVFGIGYGSVTSGAPTRPQVVDHRNR